MKNEVDPRLTVRNVIKNVTKVRKSDREDEGIRPANTLLTLQTVDLEVHPEVQAGLVVLDRLGHPPNIRKYQTHPLSVSLRNAQMMNR